MASPQLENGFTRIANELLEALCRTDLNGTQNRIMMFLMRQTYGYRRKDVTLSYQQIADTLGANREHVIKQLTWLEKHQYITKSGPEGRAPKTWSIQKDYMLWGNVQSDITDKLQDQSSRAKHELIGNVQTDISSQSDTNVQSDISPDVQTHTSPRPPYKEERKIENVRTSPQASTEAIRLLKSIGFSDNQAQTAASKRSDIPEVFPRIQQWLNASNARKPIAVLWRCLERGELPGDLPPLKPADPMDQFIRPDGSKDYRAASEWVAKNPWYYQSAGLR